MAYYSWKDIADITYNSTDLKAFVISVSGTKINAKMQEFHPAGSVWPTPLDTGMRNVENVSIEFMYDGGASGPGVKCAMATSATLTITFATGMSMTGTFLVISQEMGLTNDGDHKLTVEFAPTGTITWDVAAA